ncbi:putative fatty acyl-CoA reductase CG5065, partial [Chironomus tepperi]|uniref:putative fatty acyl-CoA reductase CG5065 n=1 Tax=Chironomus tepperi TaxID=113505 RepID=UPI00391F603E
MEVLSGKNQNLSEDLMLNNNNQKNVHNKNFATIIEENYVPIPEFYSGKSVFITGATGFLGKILVEKLLRSCPNIKNIYLLMRPKKDQKMHERLAEIFKVPLFDLIRDKNPEYFSKVIMIGGDMKSHELGISDSDQQILIQNVSIIFHCAATVRFNEKIREAIEINVKGTQKLMDLGRKLDDLKAFIYVSTAYSNCDRHEVDEIFYDISFNSQAVIDLTENFPDEFLDQCTEFLVKKRPNTYTFTKAIAEDIIRRETKLPIAVVRPSIVTATVSEPMPGWIDSLFGPTAVIAANGKGIFHTIIGDSDMFIDLVPADTVINVIIAAAWKTAQSKSSEIMIYNATTSTKNPVSWGTFTDRMFESTHKNPY